MLSDCHGKSQHQSHVSRDKSRIRFSFLLVALVCLACLGVAQTSSGMTSQVITAVPGLMAE